MEVSQFSEKLNKVDGNIYVIEEEVHLVDGVYEAELQHDNMIETTLSVWTGPKLTGNRLESYTLSTPSLAPWKRIIRVYADVPVVYISYETDGDTVEGDDINRIQTAMVGTQEALNGEEERALGAEKALTADLQMEIGRARQEEGHLGERIDVEAGRAQEAERKLTKDLAAETQRAQHAEKTNADNLDSEVTRAHGAEKTLTDNLAAEITRAKGAEKVLTDNLASEMTRAKAAEKTNSDAIMAEKSRATAAEDGIRSTITTNKPNWDDKYTRNEVDNKFSALETAIDWKEAVNTYADLITTYPHPDDGWTVNVKDTDYTYRWSGTAWVAISANAIPKATQSVDGLLSKEDKKIYDTAYAHISSKANPHAVTKSQVGLGNVENKSGATIRAEMTKADVVSALGYTPPETSIGYTHPSSGVTPGTYRNVTVNAQGHVTAGSNAPLTWGDLKGV